MKPFPPLHAFTALDNSLSILTRSCLALSDQCRNPSRPLQHLAVRRFRSSLHPQPISRPCRRLSSAAIRHDDRSKEASPRDLDANITREELSHFDRAVASDKTKQIRTPWQREGAQTPPVSRPRSAGAMTKGKLLTTPARLLKLVLPLTTRDQNTDRKDVEPLALLVHPQQPLSYLERLIQAELPLLDDKDGRSRAPNVNFNAADAMLEDDLEATNADKSSGSDEPAPAKPRVETYSGAGREQPSTDEEAGLKFVRWSKSTDIGDFIRDAARGREFAIEIEGAPNEIRVAVPSFRDRTYYLRMRLRKKAHEIAAMAKVKAECDMAAHHSAQQLAYAGFGAVCGWGGIVAWLTFFTDLGWDVMEPVTYLAGLAGLLIGYLWFLLNRREASYASAMNLTVSRRQNVQYEKRGFDLKKWQYLVEEGNQLRKEIMRIASEYDIDWDERKDGQDEAVIKALKDHRQGKDRKDEDEDSSDDGEKKED